MNICLIIAFLMIALAAGYLFKADLNDMLPFVWCGLVILLYMLAFGRALNLIDVFLPVIALAAVFLACHKGGKKALLIYVREQLSSGPFLIYLILITGISIGVSDKIVTWWDDINYWASDLKSLYFLNGFAPKYANVSPAFGDYPPGVQLAKWFCTHLDSKVFRENLAFTGYYLFNLSFLLPIFGRIEKRICVFMSVPLAVLAWLIPGVCEIYGYAGFCADLSMAMLFGNILIAAVDKRENKLFDFLRISLLLSVLVIAKSTGAIWAFFGIIIWVCYRTLDEDKKNSRRAFLRNLQIAVMPALVGGSWMLFCLLRRRVTQTTSTMVTYITTDKYGLSEYTSQFAGAFIKGFLFEPLHIGRSILNPSPAVMLVLITAMLVIFVRMGLLRGRQGRLFAILLPVIGIVYYLIIFVAHITIFATETQYLEASAMIASIERYGAPFMLGVIIFLSWLYLGRSSDNTKGGLIRIIAYSIVILVFTNIPAAWDGLVGYRNNLDEQMAVRESCIDEESQIFLDTAGKLLGNEGGRICRLRDGGYYRVPDTYVAYEASPVSVLCPSFMLDEIDINTLIMAISQTHARYFYADEQHNLKDNILDDCVPDGEFKYRQLYAISYEDGTMVLYPIYSQ